MCLQFRIVLWRLGSEERVAFVTLPTFAPLVRRAKEAGLFEKTIYYYSDQYDKYREIRNPGPIRAWNRMLQEDATAIYCASSAILESISENIKARKIARVINHQVDFDLFDYKQIQKEPITINKPIIGYFGSLTDSNDWEMIEYAAKNKPEWNFVFIGKKLIDVPELENLPNIHFMGFIPYEKLPGIAINFSVGIMFWKMTDWIKACSPLKLKEYLAMGLPVVSVPIDEVVKKYSDYVEVASNGPEFVEAVERVLDKDVKERNREFAKQYSWKTVVTEMMSECELV
jgi:glycosyltransferase involved in cell wall biosynthesis